MIPTINFMSGGPHEGVTEHLNKEFGGFQRCPSGVCTIVTPPANAIIHVCNKYGGLNLDDQGCIPPGIYRVSYLHVGLEPSHFIELIPIENGRENPNKIVRGCAGYAYTGNIDWRMAKKHSN